MWLPRLATDRLSRGDPAGRDRALATATAGGARRITAVNRLAEAAGVRPGVTVADALAVAPGLALAPHDPQSDRQLLERLADWCGHYTPWAAADGWGEGTGGGLWLDITGCAHLFGGEAKLLAHLHARLARLGFAARSGLADTPGAAWAWARFGDARQPILTPNGQRTALAALPVAALRLQPTTAAGLAGLGLRQIGDLYGLPRATIAARFGREVAHRLDQMLGHEAEPISPRLEPASHRMHMAFAEPIARAEDVTEAVHRLLLRLCAQLEAERLGVRRLEVRLFRVDASTQCVAIGTSRPVNDPRHLLRLLREPLAGVDAGFGIEAARLSASEVAPLALKQADMVGAAAKGAPDELALLLDSLGNRLGFDRVSRPAARQSHLPEAAVRRLPALAASAASEWPVGRRPLRLFSRPEPVEAVAMLPDAPPVLFRWGRRTHRLVRADGAERIAAEWWRRPGPDRDYYLVEDENGRRFWLYREHHYGDGVAPRWFLHGVFP